MSPRNQPFEPRDGRTAGNAHVVLVAAGASGVGTSTAAALLALSFAEQGRRTLLIDADAHTGCQHQWFGVASRAGIGSCGSAAGHPGDAVLVISELLELLPGGGVPRGISVDWRRIWQRTASLYVAYDVVVIDGGSRLETILTACASGVQRLVAVSGADAERLAATYGLLKSVHAVQPDLPVDFIASGQTEGRARMLYERLQSVAQRALHRGLQYGGTIPEDVPLRDWLAGGGTFAATAPHSSAVTAAVSCCGRLMAELDDVARRPTPSIANDGAARIAVALRYDPSDTPAPMVVAMGQRKVAEQIKSVAFAHQVPVIENPPLARALLSGAHTGKKIPAELYVAVAEVLAFVIRQRALASLRWKGSAFA